MNYLSDFRNPQLAKKLIEDLHKRITKPWVIMEICGGQTHAILKSGLDQLLPPEIEFIHGPGCPVCVTPLEIIDTAIEIASKPSVIFASYGDMLRVPGSTKDLMTVRAEGSDVRVVYSPLDAVKIAQENPLKDVVFFGIGFETTAPANAMSVIQAKNLGLENFSILLSQVRVPPATELILQSPQNRVQALLAAGHVCTVMGYHEYIPIAKKYEIPIVITGFEPVDILLGITQTVDLLEESVFTVKNAYSRMVSREGNKIAQDTIYKVFKDCDQKWRGIGLIPKSGWCINNEFSHYDANKKFHVENLKSEDPEVCIAGSILQGIKKPFECPAFNTICNPENPLGAPMVSSEGACAAYYHYHQESAK